MPFLMKLFLLCLFALVAFAANSVLNRIALASDLIGPAPFLAIRLISGAAMLLIVLWWQRAIRPVFGRPDWRGVGALLLYMIGFAYAYITLDTGTGALILFGGVQVTMFAGALIGGERPSVSRWSGAGLGLLGLLVLFLPGASAPSIAGALLMLAAAVGWGIYSLLGKGVSAPLLNTASNFLWAAPFGAAVWLVLGSGAQEMTLAGVLLAVASGAIASGLGYTVWYAVLPQIDASLAAVAQLTVPIIALIGGMLFLGEPLTIRFAVASVLILGGVGLATMVGKLKR